MSLIDGLAHFEVMAGKSPRFGRRQTARLELRNQLLLARQHPSAKRIHVEPSRARLSENPVRSLLFFVDMVLDLLGQHLDLGVVKFLVGTARLKFSY